ncbi:SDR family NAD(P)-dependent oxidoreductase [Mesorhizobium sp. M2C.T.Ca.TU.002.02.1.1]|uniref:SDR family NAD(P)-dependent oxidoreductase n=1 Tax=Mesorhizobium sp. M2C.T.Ca.TU.002.02.1.1 TaxID=2496788 RepID=UPI000FCC0817|nr:SDR family NAD(P)-dependent oxidoreductase [Mesorhizobium sp. M2C.T.Ca.TU.002.02.1.1]RUU56447.1 SDR family oxidoreductase [Mesorhizobium sp. M2C.T.Ca.TU.002.02.1.1]RUU62221.1 SDR family oxidoreductase [Mesorhizobium sp. M2C.T.Ca.TU.009.01.2.1]
MLFTDLSGKSALVTGASSGLGLHFAKLLARFGVRVVLTARNKDALDRAVAEMADSSASVDAVQLDVTDGAAVASFFETSGKSLDILVNNAGVSGSGAAFDLSEAKWDQVIDTNLKGVFLVAQAAARVMKQNGHGGAIVNIASILGLRVAGNVAAYAASKAGVIHLTKALALEWSRYDIRVNALCPGYIETDINRDFLSSEAGLKLISRIPQRRLGKLEELDGALLLLASAAGSYITGSTIAVDGGHLVSSL